MHRSSALGVLVVSVMVFSGSAAAAAHAVQPHGHAAVRSSADLAKAWQCDAATPPRAGVGGQVVESRRVLFGGFEVEAAGLATKGCVTLYVAPATGGRWRAYRVTADASHGNGVSSLQVAGTDKKHICVLAQGLPGAGQAPAFLFRTADGGKVWAAEPKAGAGVFPQSNVRLNMRFTSAENGWITDLNTFYGPPRVEVYRTNDGGEAWSLAAFAVPAKYAVALGNATALPPVFHNTRQGTLRVLGTMNGKTTTLVYGTADGGSTWLLESAGN